MDELWPANQKEKNSRDRGAAQESRKEKQTTSRRRLFFFAKKCSISWWKFCRPFWETGRPSKDNRAFLVAVFHTLANGLRWRALPIEHGKWWSVDDKFNRWAHGGSKTELFEQLKQRSKALIWMHHGSRPWETISRPWEPRAETNASAGRPAARQGRSAWLSMCAETRSTSPSLRSMSTIHKETRNLIQILEEKYQSKASKRDVEERGLRDFLGDRGYISSIIGRIPAVQGWISARPSRKNIKKPRQSTSALTKSGARSRTILKGSRRARRLNRMRQNRFNVCCLCDFGLPLRLVKTLDWLNGSG